MISSGKLLLTVHILLPGVLLSLLYHAVLGHILERFMEASTPLEVSCIYCSFVTGQRYGLRKVAEMLARLAVIERHGIVRWEPKEEVELMRMCKTALD